MHNHLAGIENQEVLRTELGAKCLTQKHFSNPTKQIYRIDYNAIVQIGVPHNNTFLLGLTDVKEILR